MSTSANDNSKIAPRLEYSRRMRGLITRWVLAASITCAGLQTGCTVGPKYTRPPVQAPSAYKELPAGESGAQGNWKVAQPSDAAIRGNWWELFNDPQLNNLEQKATASNQNIAAAAANFLAARAFVREARSQYFPTVNANPSIVNSRPSTGQFGEYRAPPAPASPSGNSLIIRCRLTLPGSRISGAASETP